MSIVRLESSNTTIGTNHDIHARMSLATSPELTVVFAW